ncbi:cupredoxin domain-containing protein [Kutzneria albida]|uniref:Copper binding protein of plastocyanin/azurin family n=1 Tax=Kutzneria albida DSM 43870 TaxID=1449976 RepID=W5W6A3_9PSEU|nr:cupredoxin family copper-binding protein [Kutzneria albida]AHH96442.1 copper binding protein of plastocyanin/azurin family [Kutzneria albida DSM 43870]
MHSPAPADAEKIAPPTRRGRGGVLLPAIALLAVAGSILALTTMRGNDQQTTALSGVDLAAQSAALPESVLSQQKVAAVQYSPELEAKSAASAPIAVDIKNYAYAPTAVTVAVGDTVVWTNRDTAPHTVTVSSGPEMVNSPTLQQGQSFTFTFTKPGSYSYYCAVHPDMKATLTVTGSTPPPTTTTAPPTTTTGTTTTSMPMPPPSSGGCAVKAALAPFIAHLKAAHLEEGVGQQVTDLLNLDQYVKTHTVLIENMLTPVLNGDADQAVKDVLTPLLAHLKAAHLEEGLGQQVTDLLNVDQYVKTHTVLIENMLTPVFNQLTC